MQLCMCITQTTRFKHGGRILNKLVSGYIMDFYNATAEKVNSIKSEKATKWIKMEQCVGIHSSEMTSIPK